MACPRGTVSSQMFAHPEEGRVVGGREGDIVSVRCVEARARSRFRARSRVCISKGWGGEEVDWGCGGVDWGCGGVDRVGGDDTVVIAIAVAVAIAVVVVVIVRDLGPVGGDIEQGALLLLLLLWPLAVVAMWLLLWQSLSVRTVKLRFPFKFPVNFPVKFSLQVKLPVKFSFPVKLSVSASPQPSAANTGSRQDAARWRLRIQPPPPPPPSTPPCPCPCPCLRVTM